MSALRQQMIGMIVLGLASFYVQAETHCPEHYWQGAEPTFINVKLEKKTQEVCFTEYGVMHSGVSKTPLWSAEHLTAERLENARGLHRVNAFHEEEKLRTEERAELSDYVRSGFDRGHMSPSADMSTEQAQYESFSLANMIPQNPQNNRHLWESIESAVRHMTTKRGELYVITGPLFKGSPIQRLNGRVFVPTHIYKAVYDPKTKEAAAFLVENQATDKFDVVSISELEALAGINLFPKLSNDIKNIKMELPKPRSYTDRRRKGAGAQ